MIDVHSTRAPLADLIQEKREELAQRFAARAKAGGAAESLPAEEVIDSLRLFIDELADEVRRSVVVADVPVPRRSTAATSHGEQRFGIGYDIGAVVREYGVIRELLWDVVVESGEQFTHGELRTLFGRLFDAAGDATVKYSAVRDQELRRRQAEHLAFLAHELRNPLGSARMAFGLMRERGELPAVRAADVVERSLRRVAQLIDDSLVTLRLDDIGLLDCASVDVAELLREIAEDSEEDAAAKGVSLHVVGQGRVNADRKALRSAISNLVRNAVKFTKPGGEVHVRAKRADARVVIEVEDACGGLPEGKVQKLFDPFVQVGLDRSGFGLGLAIAKQATEAHGGQLRVHDLPSKGCVFVLDLPEEPPR
jgi:signal transduction histidine kinase